MEKENEFERTEGVANEEGVNVNETPETHEGDLNTVRDSESHHSSGSHHGSSSHHGSGSHHGSSSHHKSKHSSRHKKRKSDSKKSVFKRVQNWIDTKVSRKGLIAMNVSAILLALCMLGVIFWIESRHQSVTDAHGDQQGNIQGDVVTPDSAATTSLVIPSYWKDTLSEKTEIVKALQTAGGKDAVCFVWASDPHIPDNHTGRTNDLGKLMAKMMNDCDIPFAILTGDVGTRSSYETETELMKAQASVPYHLAPLWGTDRLLVALGNHDGCFGDSSGYYRKQFAPQKLWQMYFRNQALDQRRVFSEDGLYFYVDNTAQKTRFIVLNSQFAGEYATDGNGWAVNDRFATSCYGQAQLDWLANVALDMPEGYAAVITTHVPPNMTYTADKAQLIEIINAYCEKREIVNRQTGGVAGWTSSTIQGDFTDAKGEIIAMFTGHVHQDTIDTTTLACPLITIMAAGAEVNEGETPERIFGTDTETSFDVVTINRSTRTIHCTRVGAGADRTIKY